MLPKMRGQPGVLMALMVVPSTLRASTIDVTTTSDEVAANGVCSLREAVSVAATDVASNGCSPTGPAR